MQLEVTVNGQVIDSVLLVAPKGQRTFPVPMTLRALDGRDRQVEIVVSTGGAPVTVSPNSLRVGGDPVTVLIHARGASGGRNDTILRIIAENATDHTITVTAVSEPRVFFEGRFEARFATGTIYNHPRGNPDGDGLGWMWALEGEPDFVPADYVPDRIDKPNVGRAIRFQPPAVDRPHVPPIGVQVASIVAQLSGKTHFFSIGDPVIGMPVALAPDSYFAGNNSVSDEDMAAGRVPEEQHDDGFQPIGNFRFLIGDGFAGGSRIGPYVPGTVLSSQPRTPDDRPRGEGLVNLSAQETLRYPFPSMQQFEQDRIDALLVDYLALKASGIINTPEFRNLQIRIGHLLRSVPLARRQQLLTDHANTGLRNLGGSPSFAWGKREIYRGLINDTLAISAGQPGIVEYLSVFTQFHFMCVFFNYHTDEGRGHCYGAVDPSAPPPTLDALSTGEILAIRAIA